MSRLLEMLNKKVKDTKWDVDYHSTKAEEYKVMLEFYVAKLKEELRKDG